MRMRLASGVLVVGLCAFSGIAEAQYGIPGRGPTTGGKGTLSVTPKAALHLDSVIFDLAGQVDYGVMDNLDVFGRGGILLVDFDAFFFGGGAAFQILDDAPVDVTAFGSIDVAIPSSGSFITVAGGALAGLDIDLSGTPLSVYGGAELGFSRFSVSAGGFSASTSEILLGLIGGAQMNLGGLRPFFELTLGLTDASPLLNLLVGVPFDIIGSSAQSSGGGKKVSVEAPKVEINN